MITLFGLIKKELKDKGQLIAKYREWKNSLFVGLEEYVEDIIPTAMNSASKKYNLFSPNTQDCPVDLTSKDWSFQCRVDAQSITDPGDGLHTQNALDIGIDESMSAVVRVKINGGSQFCLNQYESSSGMTVARSSSVQIGANYMRMDYKASTKVITAYYSKNGSSWTKFGTYTVKKPANMKRVWIWQSHAKATIPVDSIKFIYDGEALFEK